LRGTLGKSSLKKEGQQPDNHCLQKKLKEKTETIVSGKGRSITTSGKDPSGGGYSRKIGKKLKKLRGGSSNSVSKGKPSGWGFRKKNFKEPYGGRKKNLDHVVHSRALKSIDCEKRKLSKRR